MTRKPSAGEKTKICPCCNGEGIYEVIPAGHCICPDCDGTGRHP